MENTSKKKHWETVYQTKSPSEVSWTQAIPKTSLDFIESLGVSKSAAIIDIGGGDSKLVDYLIATGYQNLTVLDISQNAINRARMRLGKDAEKVTWIVSDINDFVPIINYDVWHDRAAFHFLTENSQIENYQRLVNESVDGFLIIGTFSENGPLKCSGLEIQQYSIESLEEQFAPKFEMIESKYEDHQTPFETIQNFVFGAFKKK